jgi:hypothetical protein
LDTSTVSPIITENTALGTATTAMDIGTVVQDVDNLLFFYCLILELDIKLIKNKKISSSAGYSGCSSSNGDNSDDSSVRGSSSAYGSIRDSIHGVHGSIGMPMPVGFQLGDPKQRVKLLLRLLRY